MRVLLLIGILFCLPFQGAYSLTAEANNLLGHIFVRMVSRAGSLQRWIEPECAQAFSKLHWESRLNFSDKHYCLGSDRSLHDIFNQELYSRIHAVKNKTQDLIDRSRVLRIGKVMPLDTEEPLLKHCFVSGKMTPLTGVTQTRKVLVSLFPLNLIDVL